MERKLQIQPISISLIKLGESAAFLPLPICPLPKQENSGPEAFGGLGAGEKWWGERECSIQRRGHLSFLAYEALEKDGEGWKGQNFANVVRDVFNILVF